MKRPLRFITLGILLAWATPVFAQMSFEGLDLSSDKKTKKQHKSKPRGLKTKMKK